MKNKIVEKVKFSNSGASRTHQFFLEYKGNNHLLTEWTFLTGAKANSFKALEIKRSGFNFKRFTDK